DRGVLGEQVRPFADIVDDREQEPRGRLDIDRTLGVTRHARCPVPMLDRLFSTSSRIALGVSSAVSSSSMSTPTSALILLAISVRANESRPRSSKDEPRSSVLTSGDAPT